MEKQTKMKFNVLAIFLIIIFCFAISPITLQNDTFYTIKIGEHIIENGIDMVDPFSWHEGLDYTYPHWVYDVLISFVYRIGGMWGIYFSTILFACILGILIYFVQSKLTKNQLLSFFLTLVIMYMLKDFIAARAQLITFIFFVLEIYCIEQFIKDKKKRYAISLVFISILIANVHVAVWPFFFVLFLPYIAEYIIAALSDLELPIRFELRINKLTQKVKKTEDVTNYEAKNKELKEKIKIQKQKRQTIREQSYKIRIQRENNVKWLVLVLIICAFTGLLTPIGDTPYTYLYKTMKGESTANISEHQPLVLINSNEAIITFIILFAFLIFTDTKIRLSDLFMIGGLLLLTFMSKRQFSMFVLVGYIVVNRLITSFIEKYDKELFFKITKSAVTLTGKIIVTLSVILISVLIFRPKVGQKFIDERSYPIQASKYILENLNLEEMRIFNEYNYGSYLLFEGIPVFVDSRADLYLPEFNEDTHVFTDFLEISRIDKFYEINFYKYDITHVIVYQNAKLNLLLERDENYIELYSDDYFVFYQRNKEK